MKKISNFNKTDILDKSQMSNLYGGYKYETESTSCVGGFGMSETVYDVVRVKNDGSSTTRIRIIKTWLSS